MSTSISRSSQLQSYVLQLGNACDTGIHPEIELLALKMQRLTPNGGADGSFRGVEIGTHLEKATSRATSATPYDPTEPPATTSVSVPSSDEIATLLASWAELELKAAAARSLAQDAQAFVVSEVTAAGAAARLEGWSDLADSFARVISLSCVDGIDAAARLATLEMSAHHAAAPESQSAADAKIQIEGRIIALRSTFGACAQLKRIGERLAMRWTELELTGLTQVDRDSFATGSRVFIGHGRSPLWRELKDFIAGRMGLEWDEFNRVPTAGITTVARIEQMLGTAGLALLVLTAEDEMADGRERARQNVIHEAGLFQGRLGFHRGILLLEDGCEEFSNVYGLGQIRFPRGRISAVFEDVRHLAEREILNK